MLSSDPCGNPPPLLRALTEHRSGCCSLRGRRRAWSCRPTPASNLGQRRGAHARCARRSMRRCRHPRLRRGLRRGAPIASVRSAQAHAAARDRKLAGWLARGTDRWTASGPYIQMGPACGAFARAAAPPMRRAVSIRTKLTITLPIVLASFDLATPRSGSSVLPPSTRLAASSRRAAAWSDSPRT